MLTVAKPVEVVVVELALSALLQVVEAVFKKVVASQKCRKFKHCKLTMALSVEEGVQYERGREKVLATLVAALAVKQFVFKVVTVIQNQILIGFYRSNRIKKVESIRLALSFEIKIKPAARPLVLRCRCCC